MEELPFSNRLFREAHQVLMKGVRGENKTPGEFRKSQNWIGGVNLKEARFVPPHPTLVPDLMSDLEKFLNNEEIHVPHLIRIALAHYQFEAIHPFLDGNGRIGRLMIILYLVNRKMLHKPVLYLSDYIEKNRMQYYDLLAAVSQGKGIVPWLRFMLRGISETAKSAGNTFIKIFAMRKRLEQETLMSLGKRIPNAQKLLLVLFEYPVITVQEVMQKMSVTKQTAHNLVEDFTRLGILKEKTGYKRNRVFVFEEYMGFFR